MVVVSGTLLAMGLLGLGGAVGVGSYLKSSSGGGMFGSKMVSIGSPETYRYETKKDQVIYAPYTFSQYAPTTTTETYIISGSPYSTISSKKESAGASASAPYQLAPMQIDQPSIGSGGGGGGIFEDVKGLILIGGIITAGVLILKPRGKKRK